MLTLPVYVFSVTHSQQKNGKLLSSLRLIELTCFLRSQNRELNPPKTKLVISSTLQLDLDFTRLNSKGDSNFLSRPNILSRIFSFCLLKLPFPSGTFLFFTSGSPVESSVGAYSITSWWAWSWSRDFNLSGFKFTILMYTPSWLTYIAAKNLSKF